jgi:ABC-2 type transport system permease protein
LPALAFASVAADAQPGADVDAQLSALTPENLVAYLLPFLFPGLGTAVALTLGALAAGNEYRWGTLRSILSQRPGRLGFLSGKLLALGALIFLFVLAAFLGGGLSSLVVALSLGASPAPPPATEFLGGLAAGALILFLWASFGFALATLFKRAALAVGLGLIYVFAVEPVLASLSPFSGPIRTIAEFLPGVNTSTLSLAFARSADDATIEQSFLDPARSAIVVVVYVAAFALVAALVFRQRDVT